MHILEQLYIGNVRPGERSFKRNSQYSRALHEAVKTGEALIDTFSDEQKEIFEAFMDAQRGICRPEMRYNKVTLCHRRR